MDTLRFKQLSTIRLREMKTGEKLMTDQEIVEFQELCSLRLHDLIVENVDVFKRLANR